MATGIVFLIVIPRHGSAALVAELPVPREKHVDRFHLAVTSYRDAAAVQAP